MAEQWSVGLAILYERLPNYYFEDGSGLLGDEEVVKYLPEGVEFKKRPASLDQNTTSILEVLKAFAEDFPAEYYLLAHATAPFLKAKSLQDGLMKVTVEEYDSALTVTRNHDFFWDETKPLNYEKECIPRTQDLPPLYVETTGAYVYSRDLIWNRGRRVGDHPYLIKVDKIEAVDINDPVDFEIADAIYNAGLYRKD